MVENPGIAEPKMNRRRWFRFSLRTRLIGILLLTLPSCWLGLKFHQAQQQRAAVAEIKKACHLSPRAPSRERENEAALAPPRLFWVFRIGQILARGDRRRGHGFVG